MKFENPLKKVVDVQAEFQSALQALQKDRDQEIKQLLNKETEKKIQEIKNSLLKQQ